MEIARVLPHLVSFVEPTSQLKYVSSDWMGIIEDNNRNIMEALQKQPGDTVFEKIISVMKSNNIPLLSAIAIDYKGYLPVNWDHLAEYISNREQFKILENKLLSVSSELLYKYATDDEILKFYPTRTTVQKKRCIYSKKPAENLPDGIACTPLRDVINVMNSNDILALDIIVQAIQQGNIDILRYALSDPKHSEVINSYINDLQMGYPARWIQLHPKSMQFFIEKNLVPLSVIQLWNDDPKIDLDNGDIFFDELIIILGKWNIYQANKYNIRSSMEDFEYTGEFLGFDVMRDLLGEEGMQQYLANEYLEYHYLPQDMMIQLIQAWMGQDPETRKDINLGWVFDRYPEVLDKYLTHTNAISLLANIDMSNDLYKLLQYKGLHPEWFQFYLGEQGIDKPYISDLQFWKKLLSQVIKDSSENYLIRIIEREQPSKLDLDKIEQLLIKKNDRRMLSKFRSIEKYWEDI